MRLMIRKPILQPAADDLENSLKCISLSHKIIEVFLQTLPEWDVLKFPYLPYLLGATMASLSIQITEPSLRDKYGQATVAAAKRLKQACHESWVSGKTAKTIARLHSYVCSVLLPSRAAPPTNPHFIDLDAMPTNRYEADRFDLSAQQRRTPAVAAPNRHFGGQMSPPLTNRGSSTVTAYSPPGNGPRAASQTSAKPMRQNRQDALIDLDLDWPELNVSEFDFEHTISGARFDDLAADQDSMMPWSGGTGSWLDRLKDFTPDAQATHVQIDTDYLGNAQGLGPV